MKRLLIDIETAPLTAHSWGLWGVNIGLNQIVSPDFMLCFAAKWYGSKKTEFFSLWDDGRESMIEAAWQLLDETDAVIHFNGKRFDQKWLNREFWLLDIVPPSPYKPIDLLATVKKHFRFPSNKLAYLLEAKGFAGKLEHEGHGLWKKVLEGDTKAKREMRKYNSNDVVVMEPMYDSLIPWITDHPNFNLYGGDGCTNCGSGDLRKEGKAYTAQGEFQRYQCRQCGTYCRSTKRLDGTQMVQEKF